MQQYIQHSDSTYLLTDFPDCCHAWLLLGLHASARDNPSVWMPATAHEQHLESEVTCKKTFTDQSEQKECHSNCELALVYICK